MPHFSTTSSSGEGVLNTLLALVKIVLKKLRDSGLAPEEAVEQLQGTDARNTTAFSRERSSVEREEYSFAEDEVVSSASLAEEELVVEPETVLEAVAPLPGDGPELVLQDGAEMVAPGCLRIPVTIRYAGKEKTVALRLMLSPD